MEPEILTDGSHDVGVCAAVTERVLGACYKVRVYNYSPHWVRSCGGGSATAAAGFATLLVPF